MPGRSPRRKGTNGERELVHYLCDRGIVAKRVPLSGAGPHDKGDVRVYIQTEDGPREVRWEVKRRKQFKTLEQWLTGNHAVAMRADHGEWMVLLRVDDLVEVL